MHNKCVYAICLSAEIHKNLLCCLFQLSYCHILNYFIYINYFSSHYTVNNLLETFLNVSSFPTRLIFNRFSVSE